jgi:hypothetical protein
MVRATLLKRRANEPTLSGWASKTDKTEIRTARMGIPLERN